jgi:CheY-like chemotaxis protein
MVSNAGTHSQGDFPHTSHAHRIPRVAGRRSASSWTEVNTVSSPPASSPRTRGALALVGLDQVDTQPLPSLHRAVQRRHILIVEDDLRVAGAIQAAIELEGEPEWAVQIASGGRHALELASAVSPDLVLLDVRLPDLDGAEVYRQLRSGPATCAARVLFLSAGTSFDLFQLGIEDGVLLRKPFNMPDLVSLVRALLHR